ncbi:hydroxyproline dehydrogenase-like isoform X2 [Hydractinia symbiolongicarpus]|uniref:hydroxyproline dehydrogenase-like isoform X2 n=1 Tax=Hydractinia symbiolongicarpus TaxID=13093 RepID=UPI0025506560|nr:hydroxyproline dehydrogenase-like isoform X2 [Hydractinia symbiolongicarpus]
MFMMRASRKIFYMNALYGLKISIIKSSYTKCLPTVTKQQCCATKKETLTINYDKTVEKYEKTTAENEKNTAGYKKLTTDYEKLDVFRDKSTKELLRTYLVLKLSSIETFVKYSDKIFLISDRFIWRPMMHKVMEATFYGQFAAGVTVKDAEEKAEKLKKSSIRSMLCVPIESIVNLNKNESEKTVEKNKKVVEDCIQATAHVEANGFAQVKLTALCDQDVLLEMNKYLLQYETNHQETGAWNVKSMSSLLEKQDLHKCVEKRTRIMIDGEQTYIQAALGYIILVLQAKFNKDTATVYNTYQCYRKDTLKRIKADHELGSKYGFKIAGKLVRGAYMSLERQLAKGNNHVDPINDTYQDTTHMYHSAVDYLLPYVRRQEVAVMIASHNESTVDYVKNRMLELQIAKDSTAICFGQLYGMCDHVSNHLGEEGYETYKSLPYGNIEDTLLYLARRSHENKTVIERTKFERLLIKKELKRRIFTLGN